MLGIPIPPVNTAGGSGGTAETVAAIVSSTLLVVGLVLWIRGMRGRDRVVHPTGVTRLRPASVH
jgi:hypothetical protein